MSIVFFEQEHMDDPKQPSHCKGRFFRGKVNEYMLGDGSYRNDKRLTPLKRMSCQGCERCDWMFEDVSALIEYGGLEVPDIEHGALYELKMIKESRDYEMGYIDDFTLGYVKINE